MLIEFGQSIDHTRGAMQWITVGEDMWICVCVCVNVNALFFCEAQPRIQLPSELEPSITTMTASLSFFLSLPLSLCVRACVCVCVCVCTVSYRRSIITPMKMSPRSPSLSCCDEWVNAGWRKGGEGLTFTSQAASNMCLFAQPVGCRHATSRFIIPPHAHISSRPDQYQVNQIDRKLTKMLNALFPESEDGTVKTALVADKVGTCVLVGWSIDWLLGRLVGWFMVGWLVGWLVVWMGGWMDMDMGVCARVRKFAWLPTDKRVRIYLLADYLARLSITLPLAHSLTNSINQSIDRSINQPSNHSFSRSLAL